MGLLTAPDGLHSRLLSIAVVKAITATPQTFTHARSGPVRVLADLTALYLARLADGAKERAELSGRTRPGLRDAVEAVVDYDGSLATLLDWLRDQRDEQTTEPTTEEKRFRAAAQLIEGSLHDPPKPRGLRTFGQLSDEELAALDGAAESDEGPADQMDVDEDSDTSTKSDVSGPSAVALGKLRAASDELVHKAQRNDAIARGHVPRHLPPFPVAELGEPVRSTAGEPSATRAIGLDDGRTVPYEVSQLAASHQVDNAVPAFSELVDTSSEPSFSSLDDFHRAYALLIAENRSAVSHRPHVKRRRLAATIPVATSPESSAPALPGPRLVRHPAGWWPYPPVHARTYPVMHGFDGVIAQTISELVPPDTLADDRAGPLAALATHMRAEHPSLAARCVRMAPPGPLAPDGMTAPFELEPQDPRTIDIASARYFIWSFDFRQRDPHNAELPTKKAVEESAEPESRPEAAPPRPVEPALETSARVSPERSVSANKPASPLKLRLKMPSGAPSIAPTAAASTDVGPPAADGT